MGRHGSPVDHNVTARVTTGIAGRQLWGITAR